MYQGLGEQRAVFMSCPICSYLHEGTCVVCEPGDEHPGCKDCEGGEYTPSKPPWYKHDITIAILTGTIIAVGAGVLGAYVQKWIGVRRK